MTTYIKTMKDKNGNIIAPRTRSEAITLSDGTTNLDDVIGKSLVYKGTVLNFAALPLEKRSGDLYYVTADEVHYFWNDTAWALLGGGASTALDVEFAPYGGIAATNVQNALQELDDEKATKASPTFTGTPSAPTAAVGTDSTQLATTAFVNAEITNDRPWEGTTTNIKMNGTQAVGVLSTIARGDHIHPTDTTRAASSHTHGNITNTGAIGTTANLAVMTATSGVLTTGTIPVASGGTGATTAAAALTNLGLTATNSEINVLDIAAGSAGKFLKSNGTTATWEVDNDTIYTHPTGFSSQPGTALSGANVISQVTVDTNGHTTGVTSRALTAGDVGAAASSHTHNYAGSASAGGAANSVANTLTFTGGSTATFNGSASASVAIPTTLPASDVYAWAKASTKPTYSASEVGLGNVTNESKATMFNNPTFTGTTTISQMAWQSPSFQNGWSNLGAPWAAARYMKDSLGFVHLRGVVANGNTTPGIVVFNLPAGYRPSESLIFAGVQNNALARINISADGNVTFDISSASWTSFCNIIFRAEN